MNFKVTEVAEISMKQFVVSVCRTVVDFGTKFSMVKAYMCYIFGGTEGKAVTLSLNKWLVQLPLTTHLPTPNIVLAKVKAKS